jgi:hypothetical protein
MKKTKVTIIFALAALGLTLVQPTSASEVKSLVIIDSYFDSRVIGGNVSCITPEDKACVDAQNIKSPQGLNTAFNHGNAMVEVAKKQNPQMKITALYSANSNNFTNAGFFIKALEWVDKNSAKVSAVSFSGYFNGNRECSPSTTNTAQYGGVKGADTTIRNLISKLKSKNIPVFIATGNKPGTKIDYPACIIDTVSVSTGSRNSSGQVVSGHAFNDSTDYVASADVYNYSSPVFGSLPHTTSSAAVAVAAQWVTKGSLTDRVVQVLP